MPEWQRLQRGRRPYSGLPLIGIQARKGTLSLNAAAYEALGAPEAVEILFDPQERMIGFHAAKPSPATYPVRKRGMGASYLVTGKALVRQMSIDISEARRFSARMIDGVLAIGLKEGGATEPAAELRRSDG